MESSVLIEMEIMLKNVYLLSKISMIRIYIPRIFFRGVIDIVQGNERGKTSSSPGRDCLHCT